MWHLDRRHFILLFSFVAQRALGFLELIRKRAIVRRTVARPTTPCKARLQGQLGSTWRHTQLRTKPTDSSQTGRLVVVVSLTEQRKDEWKRQQGKKKYCCSGVCSCVLSVQRAICIHATQLMLGGSICSTCALWVMQSECQCIHVCLMSVSMPSCTACPDNGRCCFVAECSDTIITDYTINWTGNVQYFK